MITSFDKAIAAFLVSAIVTYLTQKTGLAVPMEWATSATVALTGLMTGLATWLIPNKKVTP